MGYTTDIVGESQTREVEQGELGKGAAHVPPGGSEASLWVLGELLTRKVPSHKTGGAYSLFEVATQPGAGPPPHIHHREDEAFYVLEGEYEFLMGEEALRVGKGALLYVPKGTLHAHRGVGEGVGRMLVTQTPGGLYERFFEEVGQEAAGDVVVAASEEGSTETARIAEAAARHGIEIALRAERPRSQHPSRPTRDIDPLQG